MCLTSPVMAGNDTIRGGGADPTKTEILDGGSGNDTIYGNSPSSSPDGDHLRGGDGDDRLYAAGEFGTDDTGKDLVYGGYGNDFIYGGSGVWGGPGNDTMQFLWSGASEADGGDGNDVVRGSPFSDRLHGGAGADSVNGNGNDDFLTGGDGPDSLRGGQGNDMLISVDSVAGNDALNGDLGTDICDADPGDKVVSCR